MKQTLYTILAFMLIAKIGNGQATQPKNEVYSKEFNWHITIPENFNSLSADDLAKLQAKGADALEKTTNSKIENNTKPIFAFKADQFHYFESNYQPFNKETDGDFEKVTKNVYDVIYKTFTQQMPAGSQVDSTVSKETIDKLEFMCVKIQITLPNKIVLNMLMYNRLFDDNKDLTISILYMDKDKGNQLLSAWRNSKFE